MTIAAINPLNGKQLKTFEEWNTTQVRSSLQQVQAATPAWANLPINERATLMKAAASVLRKNQSDYAGLITLEMGKPIKASHAEIEKCADTSDYYAQSVLKDEPLALDAGRSYVAYLRLGTVLAIMSWNFPFWQVFRFAAPGLMAGNTAILKHASNVSQCGLAIGSAF